MGFEACEASEVQFPVQVKDEVGVGGMALQPARSRLEPRDHRGPPASRVTARTIIVRTVEI